MSTSGGGVAHCRRARNFLGRKNKTVGSTESWRGKGYGSIRLKSKDPSLSWSNYEDMDVKDCNKRKSEIRERDNFLELLSKVQDSRYDNQRYTIKTGSIIDTDDVFVDSRSQRNNSLKTNGSLLNGKLHGHMVKKEPVGIPTVEVTDSPTSRRIQKAASVGSIVALSEDSKSLDEIDRPSSAGSRREDNDSPTQSSTRESTLSPSRKSEEALKKVIAKEGPYPLLIDPPDGGFWLQNGECESACGEDGIWRAPEISTDHYTVQADKTAFVYGRYFRKQVHENYIARDYKHGPVLISLKLEEDYQGTLARILLRTQKDTIYKVIPSSQLPTKKLNSEDYIKIVSMAHGDEMNLDRIIPISYLKTSELLQKFDEHPLVRTHKFGVIYQRFGQTCEEELFGNVEHPDSLDEFLEMLGEKIELKGFDGYRGGLDVTNNQTGEYSVYTEFKDRKIMFHVSTLLPHDQGDTQYVQKKRHIGNDIVVIVFQDSNTPFCPNMIRSHFVHSYIVVQVEHPNTDHTVYKVAVTAMDEVPDFGPPLPDPAIFQKGAEFRDWLLTKVLNAEFNCHQAPSFKKLATRTRNQLFLHLVEEIAQSIDDIDGISLTRELTASLDQGTGLSPDVNVFSRSKKRRRTLTGMFSIKKDSPISSYSYGHLSSYSKRKSLSGSPKIFQKLHVDPISPVRHMLAGSTPDLVEETVQKDLLGLDNGHSDSKKDSQKTNIVRRLTFRKNEGTKYKEKRKIPKRASSINGPAGYSIDFQQKQGNLSPMMKNSTHSKRVDSSDESSITSGINLGGSVPFDLPGTVEAEGSSRQGMSLTVMERSGSALSLQDVAIRMDRIQTRDVAVQCTPESSSITHFHTPCSSPRASAKSEHSKRLHSVNPTKTSGTPINSRSLPNTPIKRRKSHESHGNYSDPHSPPFPFLLEHSRQLKNHTVSNEKEPLERGRRLFNITDQENAEDTLFYRADSTESVNAEIDDMYSSLLQSLEAATAEATRLREHNFNLIRENVKFASQNHDLKAQYAAMKEKLADAQEQIKLLANKLQLDQSPSTNSRPQD